MGLLSIFKREAESPRVSTKSATSESGDDVQRARTRARRRLIGAAVLLGIGIVGFPLVFETQPRPIPVNIPIEAPSKEGAAPLAMPAARPATPGATTSAAVPVATPAATPAAPPRPSAAAASAPMITESREEAGREVASAAAGASTAAPARAASKPAAVAPKPAAEPKPAPAKPPEAKPAVAEAKPAAGDAARARALLEGKAESTGSDAGRFVVQVGAFADVAAARETRAKAEKIGLKTYTQVASTAAGNRIRVRAGPYNSRAEADKALAKARAAGLTAVVLTL